MKISTFAEMDVSPLITNESPHMKFEEVGNEEDEFLITIDKLVSETEQLLDSHEKLQEDYNELKQSKRCISQSAKKSSHLSQLKEGKSNEFISEFSDHQDGCGCDEELETIELV